MKPFFITVDAGQSLMIVPESDTHADGHAVLTYSYSIFKNKETGHPEYLTTERVLKVGGKRIKVKFTANWEVI